MIIKKIISFAVFFIIPLRLIAQHATNISDGKALIVIQAESEMESIVYEDLPSDIRSQSENHLAFFLQEEAMPFGVTNLQVKKYATSDTLECDLIKYTWIFQEYELNLFESVNAIDLSLPLDSAEAIIDSVVNLQGTDIYDAEYEIAISWPATLTNGVEFSTDPEQDLYSMNIWHDRLDFYVNDTNLHVLIYKKIPQLVGYLECSSWFPNEEINSSPTVTLTSPADGAMYEEGDTIEMTAEASDTDGTITNVSFYANEGLLGSDSESPYTFAWTNAPAGGYSLTAAAWDNSGDSSTSEPITIEVTPFSPTVSLQSTDTTANEEYVETATAVISVSAEEMAGHDAVTVSYAVSGTASNGVDYETLSGQVALSVSESSVTLTITPINDDAAEGEETIILQLEESDRYTVDSENNTVTITLEGYESVED